MTSLLFVQFAIFSLFQTGFSLSALVSIIVELIRVCVRFSSKNTRRYNEGGKVSQEYIFSWNRCHKTWKGPCLSIFRSLWNDRHASPQSQCKYFAIKLSRVGAQFDDELMEIRNRSEWQQKIKIDECPQTQPYF